MVRSAHIEWYRDMRLLAFDYRIRKISDSAIHIRSFRYNDNGIYQCFVQMSMPPNNEVNDQDEWLQGSSLVKAEGEFMTML